MSRVKRAGFESSGERNPEGAFSKKEVTYEILFITGSRRNYFFYCPICNIKQKGKRTFKKQNQNPVGQSS